MTKHAEYLRYYALYLQARGDLKEAHRLTLGTVIKHVARSIPCSARTIWRAIRYGIAFNMLSPALRNAIAAGELSAPLPLVVALSTYPNSFQSGLLKMCRNGKFKSLKAAFLACASQ